MNTIKLSELPKSKIFMKHVKIADILTKETGLEHGFTFCKPKDKIIIDKTCIGNSCSIQIPSPTACKMNANFFHTHPSSGISVLSIKDKYASAYRTYDNNYPNIFCVKGSKSEHITCEKIYDIQKGNNILEISNMIQKTTDKNKNNIEVNIDKILNPGVIRFNARTGNVIAEGKYNHSATEV